MYAVPSVCFGALSILCHATVTSDSGPRSIMTYNYNLEFLPSISTVSRNTTPSRLIQERMFCQLYTINAGQAAVALHQVATGCMDWPCTHGEWRGALPTATILRVAL